jgi:signal transduction histidine kinase
MQEHKWFFIGLFLFTIITIVISYIVLRIEYDERDTNATELMDDITSEFRVTLLFILESFQRLLDTHSVIIGHLGKNISSDFFGKLVASDLLMFSSSIHNFRYSPIIYNDERDSHNRYGRQFINPNYMIQPFNRSIDDSFLNRTYYLPIDITAPDPLITKHYGLDLMTINGIDTILNDLNNINKFIVTSGFHIPPSIDHNIYIGKLIVVEPCDINSSVNFDTLIRNNKNSRCIRGISYITTLYSKLISLTLSFYAQGPDKKIIESLMVIVTTAQNGHEYILYKPNTINNYTIIELRDKYDTFYRSINLTYGDRQFVFSILFTDEVYDPSLVNKILITWIVLPIIYIFLLVVFILIYYFIRKNMKLENQKVEDLYTLITYVNHELRNPLNVLLSLINISIRLIKNILNSPNSHSTDKLTDILIDILGKLEIAHGSNYSVMTIINDVSELKHIRNGTIKINMDVISLESIGTKTIHSLQYKLDENKYLMTLEYVNTDPDFLIYADPVRINQILINFITNAIVHAKSKVIYFSIYREHSKIYFKVRDIGVGISPIIQSKIFKEKFIQNNVIDQAMRIGGVGIGLYICYHVAKAIGADVDFVSDDTGTTFWLCIDENKVKIPKNISLDV